MIAARRIERRDLEGQWRLDRRGKEMEVVGRVWSFERIAIPRRLVRMRTWDVPYEV
jgi:hypothetical protein